MPAPPRATGALGGDGEVIVEGLAAFQRQVRKLAGHNLGNAVKSANKAAAEVVATDARKRVKRVHPKMGPRVQKGIVAVSDARGSLVRLGGKGKVKVSRKGRKPSLQDIVIGLEYGVKSDVERRTARRYADTARNRALDRVGAPVTVKGWNSSVFRAWRGNQHEKPADSPGVGYFLHPAVRANVPEIIATHERAIAAVVARVEAFQAAQGSGSP